LLQEWELHYYKAGDTAKKIGTIDISTATVSQNLAALWAPPSIPKAPNKPGTTPSLNSVAHTQPTNQLFSRA
jgi:hypothetical protein